MRTLPRLAAFAVVLVALLGAGYGIGTAAGPAVPAFLTSGAGGHGPAEDRHGGSGAASGAASGAGQALGGLASTEAGYTLRPQARVHQAGTGSPVTFTIIAPDGRALTRYEVEQEKQLHLIAVRRDLSGYQHVHPTRDDAGVWKATLDLTPGSWRLLADFVPGGAKGDLVLGTDIEVAGAYEPATPAPTRTEASAGDLAVQLTGTPRAGKEADLAFRVTRNGAGVATEPYLGARGHLVALRGGDLGYLHVHPDQNIVAFRATFPTPGRYSLFLDVKVDGQVRTVPFTVEVPA